MDLIAGATGFDEYYGLEDYPILLNYIDAADRPLGWDYDALMYLLQKLEGKNLTILPSSMQALTILHLPECMNPLTDTSMVQTQKEVT